MLYDRAWACNYDELITYYPLFYRDIKEMDAILRAHGKIADDLEAGIEQVFANNFIDTANEATIERLEKFLDLGLNRSRTLEERRRLVKSFFAGFGSVSASMLEGIVRSYTDAEVSVRFEPFDDAGNNMLYIEFGRGNSPTLYMSDINLLLNKKIPAHIKWQAAVVYPFPIGIGIKRMHYRFGYDLAGTKPDIAMLGLTMNLTSVIEAQKSIGLLNYEAAREDAQTGKHPDIATIGSYLAIKDVIETKAEIYTTDLKKAQNGDLEAGVWPDVTAIGQALTAELAAGAKDESHISNYEAAGTKPEAAQAAATNEINAGAGVKATDYDVNYIYCGTQYSQS